jgi:hypothetical protein
MAVVSPPAQASRSAGTPSSPTTLSNFPLYKLLNPNHNPLSFAQICPLFGHLSIFIDYSIKLRLPFEQIYLATGQ